MAGHPRSFSNEYSWPDDFHDCGPLPMLSSSAASLGFEATEFQCRSEFALNGEELMKRFIVKGAAWLEVIVGISVVTIPYAACRMLFGVTPEGVAILLARFAGVALLGLGIGCLPSKITGPSRSAVVGLLTFNVGATVFFVWVVYATSFRGVLLWPAGLLHAVISVALLTQFPALNFDKSR